MQLIQHDMSCIWTEALAEPDTWKAAGLAHLRVNNYTVLQRRSLSQMAVTLISVCLAENLSIQSIPSAAPGPKASYFGLWTTILRLVLLGVPHMSTTHQSWVPVL